MVHGNSLLLYLGCLEISSESPRAQETMIGLNMLHMSTLPCSSFHKNMNSKCVFPEAHERNSTT